jgi:hypothetical protein
MAKISIQSNHRVQQVFEDLKSYLDFCRSFGYKYDEKELYDNKSYSYRQYTKFLQGKTVKDNWEADAKA